MARESQSWLAMQRQVCKQALTDLWRRPLGNVLTLAVLTVALTLPACFYIAAKNISIVSQAWQNPTQLTVYLASGSGDAEARQLLERVSGWQEVAQTDYISPQQGLEEFRNHVGFTKALSLLDENPLPAVLVIKPTVQWQSSAAAARLAEKLRDLAGVDDVRLDSDWLQRLEAIQQLSVSLAMLMAGLMLLAVFLIVGNTLRLQLQNQKEAVQVMKLVGATNTYILRPFLYTGAWYGLLASVFALVLTTLVCLMIESAVDKLALLYGSDFHLTGLAWDECLLLIMLSSLLGVLAARLSAGRHLKEIEPI
ncbi:permease-like cell division protein FtsX [Photobacterium sp. CCB-ST2H9]|uniref:permease-like cell division protein FtsX n=1 Tax=unclassified Photobacterium TaxID=2628852 RepID=UPI002006424F|nr:permease-like cell division protein FtsX [Photobacterium sp. CCB-ST2H9]UTM57431.1 permease-like cell division protein FtsX [Photobacterium sp. CCB-ST2H9]